SIGSQRCVLEEAVWRKRQENQIWSELLVHRAEPGRKTLMNTTKPDEQTDTHLALLENWMWRNETLQMPPGVLLEHLGLSMAPFKPGIVSGTHP
ncbi:hypothetical protein LEMLEM_LOCUS3851, partial [Lemmus lemmus]